MCGLTPKSGRILALIVTKRSRAPTTLHSELDFDMFPEIPLLTLRNRHRRIHEAHHDGQQSLANDEDFENEDNETGSADENSSPPQAISNTMVNAHSMTSMPSMNMPSAMSTMMGPQMIAPQLLQQQI